MECLQSQKKGSDLPWTTNRKRNVSSNATFTDLDILSFTKEVKEEIDVITLSDLIGSLGGSLKGKHLQFLPRVWEARWLSEHYKPSAMMDLSDGVAKDLPRLAKQSCLGYQMVYQRIPRSPGCELRQALNDGEDYELMFTVAPGRAEALKAEWLKTFPTLPLTNIGWLCPKDQSMGSELDQGGWDHFQVSVGS